jgi:hypothetical protein
MAIDPQQIAEEQTQRSAMDAAGSPTEFAEGPQLAGIFGEGAKGGWAAISQLLKGPKRSTTQQTIFGSIGDFVKNTEGAATPPDKSRVPNPAEEDRAFEDVPQKTAEYRKRQLAQGQRILSPEGFQKFKDRGLSAFPDDSAQIISDADDALRENAKLLAQKANKKAQEALTATAKNKESNFKPDETKTLALADRIKNHNAAIQQYVDEAGPFNMKYIETPEDLDAVFKAVNEVFSEESVARTRGKVPNDVTLEQAALAFGDTLNFSREILKRKIGDNPLVAHQMVAARMLLADAGTTARETANQLKLAEIDFKAGVDGAAQRVIQLEEQFERELTILSGIQLQVKGSQTELGRAFQSQKIPIGGEKTDEALGAVALKITQQGKQGDLTSLKAQKFLEISALEGNEGANRFSFLAAGAKTRKMIIEAFTSGLLWNVSTQLKNLVGNASFMIYGAPAELMAAGYAAGSRQVRRASGFEIPEDQVEFADALLRMKGYVDAFEDAWSIAGKAFKTETPGQKPSKLDLESYNSISVENPKTIFGHSFNHMGKILRLPLRALLAGDEFFKVLSSRGELYTRVNNRYHSMRREGLTHQEAMDEAGMLLSDTRAIGEEIDEMARYQTMQTQFQIMQKFNRFLELSLIGKLFVTFVTAPTNSMLKLAEFSPLGAAMSSVRRAVPESKIGISARQHQLQMGRAMFGTTTMFLFAKYAMEGKCTGGFPRDKDAREALPSGWKPYSCVFKDEVWPVDENGEDLPLYNEFGIPNGQLVYVPYSAVEPIGAILGVSSDIAQRVSESPNTDSSTEALANYIGESLSVVIDYFKELPMLAGISDAVDVFRNPNRIDLITRSFAENQTAIAGIPNPFSGIQRAIMDVKDPTKTRPRGDLDYYDIDHALATDSNGKLINGIFVGDYDSDGNKILRPDPDRLRLVGMPKNSGLAKAFQQAKELRKKDSVFFNEYDYNAKDHDTFGNVKSKSSLSIANRPFAAVRNRVLGIVIEPGAEPPKKGSLEFEFVKLHETTGEWPLKHQDQYKTISNGTSSVPIGYGVQSDLIAYAKTKTKKYGDKEPSEYRDEHTGLTYLETLRGVIFSSDYQLAATDFLRLGQLKAAENDFMKKAMREFLLQTKQDPSDSNNVIFKYQKIRDAIASKDRIFPAIKQSTR